MPRSFFPADLSRLSSLGLSCTGFGLVAESEVAGDPDVASAVNVHEDGEPCRCQCECEEWLTAHFWPKIEAERIEEMRPQASTPAGKGDVALYAVMQA